MMIVDISAICCKSILSPFLINLLFSMCHYVVKSLAAVINYVLHLLLNNNRHQDQ